MYGNDHKRVSISNCFSSEFHIFYPFLRILANTLAELATVVICNFAQEVDVFFQRLIFVEKMLEILEIKED